MDMFENNTIENSIFNVIQIKLFLSNSIINNHDNTFLISSNISLINIYNISTNNVKILYLNDSRLSYYQSNVNIYDSNFKNSKNGFEIYLKKQDLIYISINILFGNDNNNDFNSNNNKQFEIVSSKFYDYNNQNIFYFNTNLQNWFTNISFISSFIFNSSILNDNDDLYLFIINNTNNNNNKSFTNSIINIDNTIFENNENNIFLIIDQQKENDNNFNDYDIIFDNIQFKENSNSAIKHIYYNSKPNIFLTFNNCEWYKNKNDENNSSLISITNSDYNHCNISLISNNPYLTFIDNNFTLNTNYKNSIIKSFCGTNSILSSIFLLNNESTTINSEKSIYLIEKNKFNYNIGNLMLNDKSTMSIISTIVDNDNNNNNNNDILLCPNKTIETFDENNNGFLYFENIFITNNKLMNESSINESLTNLYLINLKFHRILISNLKFINNLCLNGNNNGCILTKDSSIT